MATIVLTAVGSLFGGPLGAAIGATLGRAIDQRFLFAPKGRSGPRLSDMRLQTSSYGTSIPRLYGTMRVAGTVIWSTDLRESRQYQKGGKGKPSVTTYSYSASFAVAIASRPLAQVRRIWADGNLLRGSAGDFKTGIGGFRLVNGSQDQAVDPLLGAATGSGASPAYRGMAYAVFDDLQLADFGNRIPSITFEVVADDGPVSAHTIAHDLSDKFVVADGVQASVMLDGYAATGQTLAEALTPLVEGFGLDFRVDGATLSLDNAMAVQGQIGRDVIALSVNGKAVQPLRAARQSASGVPTRLTVRHYDATRDFQSGLQGAVRPGPGYIESSLDMPATLSASAALAMAQSRLRAMWMARSTVDVECGWSAMALSAGSTFSIVDHPGLWRLESRNWEDMRVKMHLRRVASESAPPETASSGASISQVDSPHGPTRMALMELPSTGDDLATEPVVVLATCGPSAQWRRASLFVREGDNGTLTPIGASALPATMGQVVTPPLSMNPALFDLASVVEVELANEATSLNNASDLALAQGANLCMLGEELIQFGSATPLGGGRYRLHRLLRGRRGSEAAIGAHVPGERFVLLEQDRLFTIPSSAMISGASITISAIGIGDDVPVEATITVTGRARLPLSPVHVRAKPDQGGWRIMWTRRSRSGWRWGDSVDAPLAEEAEGYHVEWRSAQGVFRSAQTAMPEVLYDAAALSADLLAGHGGLISVTIRQVGTYGVGATSTLHLQI
jgi:Putative phage tail protein